jgi:hypothetical protein
MSYHERNTLRNLVIYYTVYVMRLRLNVEMFYKYVLNRNVKSETHNYI